MPGARLAPCVAPYVLRVCVTVWVYCLLLTYHNRVPFVWVLKCRPAARARESRERAPGGLFPRGAGAGGSSGPRVCRLRGALPSPASGRSPDPRSTIALRAETAGARRGAAGVHVRSAAARASPRRPRRRPRDAKLARCARWRLFDTNSRLAPRDAACGSRGPRSRRASKALIRARSTRSAAPRSVGGSAAGAQPAHLVTLVDKLHDVLAVAELHHSRGRRVQAARVGHQRWLGHAHQHHPLRRPLHHSPPSCWWCSAELKTVRAAKVCSSDFPRNKAPPQGNEPCRRDLHAREGRNAAPRDNGAG